MFIQFEKTMHEQQSYALSVLNDIQALFERTPQKLSALALDTKIVEGLIQLYTIGTNIEDPHSETAINHDDITQVGEYGFNLLTELLQWAHKNHLDTFAKSARELVLSLALWITQYKGEIRTLEPVVDALTQIANKTVDTVQLTEIVTIMDRIIFHCSSVIKNDPEKINPLRPWRVIHLNRAITATRSHDTELMQRVFQELVNAFPDDVADFFSEGVHEMDRLNYPDPVRAVLYEFFDRYSRPKMN